VGISRSVIAMGRFDQMRRGLGETVQLDCGMQVFKRCCRGHGDKVAQRYRSYRRPTPSTLPLR
jgi:hypothetical protein